MGVNVCGIETNDEPVKGRGALTLNPARGNQDKWRLSA
jgi:hypothetical protein